MANRRSPLSKKEQAELDANKGELKDRDKGKVVPLRDRVPTNELYKHMSKKEFVAAMALLNEKKIYLDKKSKEFDEQKKKEMETIDKENPVISKEDIAVQISELVKLHHSTEKSIRAKIESLPDEVDQKSLTALLDEKKEQLESGK